MLASNGILQVLVILNGSGEDHIHGSYNVQSMEYIYCFDSSIYPECDQYKARSRNNLTHLVHHGMSAEENIIYLTD